jgi:hypothetical protein
MAPATMGVDMGVGPVSTDFIANGQAYGPVAQAMMGPGGALADYGLQRPYFETNPKSPRYGQRCVTVNTGRTKMVKVVNSKGQHSYRQVPERRQLTLNEADRLGYPLPLVVNATSLRKEEWLQLDTVVLRAARYRLRAWADLAAANSFGGFNGMAKMILEHETMSDPGEAITDMDGLTEGRTDSPQFQLQGLPLPLTHSDFWFSSRRLAVSRNTGTPLDTTMGEVSGRRMAEQIEKVTIGVVTGLTYGGNSTYVGGYGRTPSVYGYTNFPNRLTKTNAYLPTGNGRSGTGWVPADTLKDVLAARDALYLNKFYGPFMLYTSNDWDQYLDNDYILTGGNVATQTLRDRLKAIEGIVDVRRLDFLFASTPSSTSGPGGNDLNNTYPFTMLFVQMTPDVARAVNGLDITTVQWESVGGLRLNFKTLCFGSSDSVITRDGVKEMGTLVNKRVEVVNRHGKTEQATVRSFGEGRLCKVDVDGCKPIYCTPEHRWWTEEEGRISTRELRRGHTIPITGTKRGAKVRAVEDTGRNEEVFCAVVPGSESFTLGNGLVTSNCIQVPQLRADFYGNAGLLTMTASL